MSPPTPAGADVVGSGQASGCHRCQVTLFKTAHLNLRPRAVCILSALNSYEHKAGDLSSVFDSQPVCSLPVKALCQILAMLPRPRTALISAHCRTHALHAVLKC